MSQISSPKPPEVCLPICTDRIGDTTITLPSDIALRKKYHTAFIVFLALLHAVPLIEQHDGIALFLTYELEDRNLSLIHI